MIHSSLISVFAILSLMSTLGIAKERPNIVLIVTDDQGYGDLGFHGNDKIDTPVLDRLATESTRFDRFMVCPLCSMTRASLLTGRYNLRTGCASVTRGVETVRPDEVLIPEVLKTAGYTTGCFGKWHIGEYYPSHPRGQGFDDFFGMPQGHWDNYFDPMLERNGEMVQTKGYISDVLTDAAMAFIRTHAEQPFFCYLPYNAPHTPMQVADHYYDKYRALGLAEKPAAIYGMVQNIDENIGRLLEQLDTLGIANETIVIFLSDNGAEGPQGSRYNAGMLGMKGTVNEGGVRVPLFVRWPRKIKPDRSITRLTAHVDLLPTIAELCGIDSPETKPLDGLSLVPLLLQDDGDWPEDRMVFARSPGWKHMVGAFGKPVVDSAKRPFPGSVRSERWRAVNEGTGWQLFDMQADPGQTTDTAESHPGVVTHLAKAYGDWLADVSSTPITRPVIDIGHPEWPTVKLTVPEAYFTGDIHWYNRWGFAHDWLTGWSTKTDRIWWETNIVQSGRYEVSLKYACYADAVGTKLRVSAVEPLASTNSLTEGTIRKSHEPKPTQRSTRIDKKRFVQTFATQSLGGIELKRGRTRLTIEAIHQPGKQVCDVHSVILRRVD
jgi:arylsulfatase A-like enzyme